MKNYLSALLGFMIALAITTESHAQTIGKRHMQNENSFLGFSDILALINSPAEGVVSVNVKALKLFSKLYKKINNASWDKTVEGYRASFTLDNTKNAIYFDNKGHWVAGLITYQESKFAKNLRDMVKREYYDYNIYQVQEVTTLQSDGIPTFIVYLESKDSLKTLLIYDGEMQVWQDFKKQH